LLHATSGSHKSFQSLATPVFILCTNRLDDDDDDIHINLMASSLESLNELESNQKQKVKECFAMTNWTTTLNVNFKKQIICSRIK